MPCDNCDNPTCNGKLNVLRFYDSWEDLSMHAGEEQIVEWVNELARQREQQRSWGKRYRSRQQAFTKIAKKMLDPDELERLEAHVEEQLDADKR